MDGAFETTDPKRRRLLGVLVMAGIALLQLASEYLGTHDTVRLVSKSAALLIGLPLLVVGASSGYRWAARTQFGALGPLFAGALTAGLFFAGLLSATRAATFSFAPQLVHSEPYGEGDVLRVGFAMGLTYFALWALAFVLPAVAEDARVRALEADKLRTQAELAQLRSQDRKSVV